MSKNTFVISCPIDCYSGYSGRSRDIVKAIIELDKYDVKIMPQRWGDTPWGFIKDHPEWQFLEPYILKTQLTIQPDIWCQITVPNEFQPIGKYNIGITAGIESDVVIPEWIEGVNRMNLTLVSSNHSKKGFENGTYEKRDQNGNVVGIVKLERPIEVLFEGASLETYFPKETSKFNLANIKEDFAYLFLGHWMNGDFGEDRKNTSLLVKAFYETFKNKTKKPALILKTSGGNSSYMDREAILTKIRRIKESVNSKDLPNVYLLHGEFSDSEINDLYNHPKVKAMVNLTKGEGFGRPLLEFSLIKKPIITSNWSGHIDFLSEEFCCLLNGTLTPVHPSTQNQFLLKESKWFSVDHGQVGHYLRDVFENYKNYTDKAKRQAYRSKTEFSFEKMKEKLDKYLTKNVPELPKQVQLKLPTLKKIELPKLKKIEE